MSFKPPNPLWTEQSLEEAFWLVHSLTHYHHEETDAHRYLKQALDAIENADVAIEKGQ